MLVVSIGGLVCSTVDLSEVKQNVLLDFASNASGRVFDGIGGLSGGGATSTFLLAYKEPERSQILGTWITFLG